MTLNCQSHIKLFDATVENYTQYDYYFKKCVVVLCTLTTYFNFKAIGQFLQKFEP